MKVPKNRLLLPRLCLNEYFREKTVKTHAKGSIRSNFGKNNLNFEIYQRNSYHNIAHMKFEKTKENERVNMGYQKEEEIAVNDLEMHFIEIPKNEIIEITELTKEEIEKL